MADLTLLPLPVLDQLGVLAAEDYDNVEIVTSWNGGLHGDRNAPHGNNTEIQMRGGYARVALGFVVAKAKGRLTTSQLRVAWAPHCTGPWARITLYGGATITVRPAMIDAFRALDQCLRRHGYRATPPDCGAYNCRRITNGSGYSLHAYGIAADINWLLNPYGRRLITDMPVGLRTAIKAIRTNSGAPMFGWGGDYSGNKDAMHYEAVCAPRDVASGIDQRTVPGFVNPPAPGPKPDPPKPEPVEEDMAKIVRVKETRTLWVIDGVSRRHVTESEAQLLAIAKYATLDKGGVPFEHPKATVELVPVVEGR